MNHPSIDNVPALKQKLHDLLEEKGHRANIVSVKRISSLRQTFLEWHKHNLLDKDFMEEQLTDFSFDIPKNPAGIKSIVVIASPQPHRRVSITLKGKPIPFIIPPHYSYETDAEVSNILGDFSKIFLTGFLKAALPLKLLATSSGLAEYGKNNIAFVQGMGSYFRLSAYFSDLPPGSDSWLKPRMMERCLKCESCTKSCPTGAISSERFLIHGERCLTLFNERIEDFPSSLNPSWHNCLVGCLLCQQYCPENKPYRDRIEDSCHFTEAETSSLLTESSKKQLPKTTIEKLKRLGMLEYRDVLPRNIRVLLARQSAQSAAEHSR